MDAQNTHTKPLTNASPNAVICLGASAGGLEALERFFRHMTEPPPVIYILIQHLSPDYKSVMGDLLKRYTRLDNVVVEDGLQPQPGRIHLIPPGQDMEWDDGCLRLIEREGNEPHLPINRFLVSAAQDLGADLTAIILSGTGSDGSRGVMAVHEAGGMVLVQDPSSAKFDGMPRSAIATGVVDCIGTPEDLADLLAADETAQADVRERLATDPHTNAAEQLPSDPQARIFTVLGNAYGIDFSRYKDATILRRLDRRMQMCASEDLAHYANLVASNDDERDRLYRDLLVEVTEFFRNPQAFARLGDDILPDMLSQHPEDQDFRVWVAACATGEEAYSMAILIDQVLQGLGLQRSVRIFATDIHRNSLRIASAGCYSAEALQGLDEETRERYFEHGINGWTIRPRLRRMITVAPHNLLRDPPFLHMSLVSCRNMLIYLRKEAQGQVLLQFTAALERQGVLFLGSSESMLENQREFVCLDAHHKLFRKVQDIAPGTIPSLFRPAKAAIEPRPANSGGLAGFYPLLMERCMPPGFVINAHHELIHTFGGAGRYLTISGPVKTDITGLLQGNLRVAVATALERARKSQEPVRFAAISHPAPHH